MLLSASSCVKEEVVVFDPSTATAPVLGAYEIGAKKVTAEYTPASFKMDFNQKMPINHSIVLVSADGKAANKLLATGSDGQVSVTNATISKALTSLGFNYDQTVAIELAIRASLQDPTKDNGRNGFIDSKDHIMIPAFLVEAPAKNPFEGFDKESPWGVTGSIAAHGISWDKDIAMVSDGTWHVAKSVTLAASDQFKFRRDGGWDVNVGAAGDVEPYIVSLDEEIVGTGNGKNLAVGSDGVYDLWVNGETNAFKVTEAYNPYPDFKEASTWGITGALSSYGINWDGDISMLTDGNGSHLAQGVRIVAADQFKFRKDQAWDENYGGTGDAEPCVVTLDAAIEASAGGKNLGVPADGVYDLILNESSKTITVVETLGGPASQKIGGDEPDDPDEPETFTGWSIIGTVNGCTGWDTDFDMDEIESGVFYINGVTLAADTEFKIRKDHDWAVAYGTAPDATVALDAAFAATTDNGGNIMLGADAKVDITLNTNDNTILLASHKGLYSLIGAIEGTSWSKDFNMTESAGKWTLTGIQIDGEFKVRFDASWDDDKCYGVADGQEYGLGAAFELCQPGANINLGAGKYNVTFDPEAKTLLVENSLPDNTWSLIGEISGTSWDQDFFMNLVDGLWISDKVELVAGKSFKLRFNHDWAVNRGATGSVEPYAFGINESVEAVQDGKNLTVKEDGTYQIVYDPEYEQIFFLTWSAIGTVGGTSWDTDFVLRPSVIENDVKVSLWEAIVPYAEGQEFKVRYKADWAFSYGGVMTAWATPFQAVSENGANIKAPEACSYVSIMFDPSAETISVGRADWGIIGDFNGWGGDVVMVENEPGIYYGGLTLEAASGVKIRKDRAWTVDRGGSMAALGEAFDAVQGGANISLDAGKYIFAYDSVNEKLTISKL